MTCFRKFKARFRRQTFSRNFYNPPAFTRQNLYGVSEPHMPSALSYAFSGLSLPLPRAPTYSWYTNRVAWDPHLASDARLRLGLRYRIMVSSIAMQPRTPIWNDSSREPRTPIWNLLL